MIKFDESSKVFYLDTDKTTYAFGILEEKIPVHIYWGQRLNKPINKNWANVYTLKNFSANDYGNNSTNSLPLEFPVAGGADHRIAGLEGVCPDGSRMTKFYFAGYEITDGKPTLEGLPSTYSQDGDRVQTLSVKLIDELAGLDVFLSFSVFEKENAITRNVKIVSNKGSFRLDKLMSTSVDFFGMPESDIIHLDGTWARERTVTRKRIVSGDQFVESRTGASSAYHNPFIAICDKDTTENCGDAYGLSLVYSGNFIAGAELNPYNCGRAYIGINPFGFEFILNKGESFQTPEAVLAYSREGLSGMSRIYHHLYRTRLCRGKYRDADRFVLINNWEATYFDFNEEKIVSIAKKASEIGVDTMVLDDGWFGARTNDSAGLGDWFENTDRLPDGLDGLAKRINALGMRFGLWFEPEMVNPDSELYRKHPDWVLHTNGRDSSLCRNQLTLDLSRHDVCDYIIDAVSAILRKANIEYVKWDMNRYMTEVGSALLPAEQQGEIMHRYMLGLYRILETITSNFPNVLFESCSSGGSRFDPGMLYYMPQTWTSDDTDAVQRMMIQYGTSFVYPYSAMGAHVSACPNHQTGRTVPFEMRCNVAMPGQFGFELDLNRCTEAELETARKAISQYRKLQRIFHNGSLYRLKSPFETDMSVLEFISEDENEVVLCVYGYGVIPSAPNEFIRLFGLDPKAAYSLDGETYGGDYLINRGYYCENDRIYKNEILHFKKV